MGINKTWWDILYTMSPSSFIDGFNDLPDYVIDDFMTVMHASVRSCGNWQRLGEVLRDRIIIDKTNKLKQYIVLFDENEFVRKSKYPTRRNRNKKVIPYVMGVDTVNIGKGVIRDGERILATRWLHPMLIQFCTEEIRHVIDEFGKLKSRPLPYITIDGAITSHSDINGNLKQELLILQHDKPPVRLESYKIGESDMKIVNHLVHINEERNVTEKVVVLIKTIDSDTLPILLLNMIDLIDPVTQNIEISIYLESEYKFNHKNSSNGKHKTKYIDVVSLWRGIIVYFNKKFPRIEHPILSMCLLLMLTKTDYVTGFKQIGPSKVWSNFCDRGHELFALPCNVLSESGYEVRVSQLITQEVSFGNKDKPNLFLLDEGLLFKFINYLYHKVLTKTEPRNDWSNMKTMEVLRDIGNKMDKGKIEKQKFKIKSDEDIMVTIRNLSWNLLYWCNEGCRPKIVPDPLVRDTSTNKSIYGWVEISMVIPVNTPIDEVYCSGDEDEDDDDSVEGE